MVHAHKDEKSKSVLKANIALHAAMADEYNANEPHFRKENVDKVERILTKLFKDTNAKRLLDMGCGTGFIINIAKKYMTEIHGVDITVAMMNKIDKSGKCKIELHEHDAGTFPVQEGSFDMVTGYAFLHHLYDIKPILRNAYKALKPGGKAYFDLEPNYYFWKAIAQLDRYGAYDPLVKREIEMVTFKDEDIEANFGVPAETFNDAEYGKSIKGGFKEEVVREVAGAIGFSHVEYNYNWFLGQAAIYNAEGRDRKDNMADAEIVDGILNRILPMSRHLYKYVGFVLTK